LNYPLLLQCGQVRVLAYRQPGEKHKAQQLFYLEKKNGKNKLEWRDFRPARFSVARFCDCVILFLARFCCCEILIREILGPA
jgi:hypothetical protein